MEMETFTSLAPARPDPAALLAAIRTASGDPLVEVDAFLWPLVRASKATPWTAPQITATQAAVHACPAWSPQRQAQNEIDDWPLSLKAFALALVDQLNVLRTQAGMQTITAQQALQAIRAKAGQIS